MGCPQQQKQLAALTAQPAIIFDNEGQDGKRKAPTEFRIFHAGVNATDKGNFLFDEKAAIQVIDTYRQRGVPLMGDYEHQTANAAKNGQPAPNSITEWTPEIRRDAQGGPELWATKVKWTDKARGMLEAGEYRMFSPLFTFDDDADRRPNWMINLALTNNPATHGQEPLVAASAETTGTKELNMCELCGRLEAKMSAMADEHRAHLKGLVEDHTKQVESLTAKLKSFEEWAAEESKEHGGDLTALSAFRREVCALSGEKTLAGALGVLKAHKVSHEQHAALKTELETKRVAALSAEFDTKLSEAVKGGKIPPAQKEFWQQQQKDLGVEKGLAMLSGYVATLSAPIVSSTSITTTTDGGEPNGLTAGQLAAAAKMGLKVEQLTAGLKFHQAQLATMQGRG